MAMNNTFLLAVIRGGEVVSTLFTEGIHPDMVHEAVNTLLVKTALKEYGSNSFGNIDWSCMTFCHVGGNSAMMDDGETSVHAFEVGEAPSGAVFLDSEFTQRELEKARSYYKTVLMDMNDTEELSMADYTEMLDIIDYIS